MATTYSDIKSALITALEGMAGLPLMPDGVTPAVAWPNRSFTPPDPPSIYLKPTVMFSPSKAITLGLPLTELFSGIFQISVFAPPNDTGDIAAYAMADLIISTFKTGSSLTFNTAAGLTIVRSWIGPSLGENSDWYHIPVSISFNVTATP